MLITVETVRNRQMMFQKVGIVIGKEENITDTGKEKIAIEIAGDGKSIQIQIPDMFRVEEDKSRFYPETDLNVSRGRD